jgi:hypothetical protein
MKNQGRNLSVLLVIVLVAISFSTIWGVSEGRLVKAATTAQITTTLLSEGFEGSFPPSGWFTEAVSGTTGIWAQSTDTVHPSGGGTHSDGYLTYFNSWTATAGDAARLYTPNLDFGAAGYYYLSFWMYHDLGLSNLNDYLQIEVNNGSGWIEVGNAIYRYDGTQGWAQHTIDLSAYAGQVIHVSLEGVSAWGNDIHIDDVLVYSQTSPNPASVYVYLPLVQKGASQITPTKTLIYTPTKTPTRTNTPVSSGPKLGTWTFTHLDFPEGTYMGNFYVTANGVSDVYLVLTISISPSKYCSTGLTGTGSAITNNAFSFYGLLNGTGTFTSTTSANGNLNASGTFPQSGCTFFNYSNRFWTATWTSN